MVVDNGTSVCQGITSSLYLNWNISVIYCRIEVKFVLVKEEWWWLLFGKNTFYVTCGLANMTALSFQLRISLLLFVGLNHKLVSEIWKVHIILRCLKYDVSLKVTLTFWVNCNVNEYFLCFFYFSFYNSANSWPNHFKFWTVVVEKGTSGCMGIMSSQISLNWHISVISYLIEHKSAFVKLDWWFVSVFLTWNVIK